MEILLATNNQKKLKELREILADLNMEIRSLSEVGIDVDVEETGNTFEGNALIKARAYRELSGMATLADDSGLVVKALNGAPGVFSARYSGISGDRKDEANIDKLLAELKGVEDREAYFACAIAYLDNTGKEYTVEGRCYGKIGFERRGDYGFGYDPVFLVDGQAGKAMAELKPDEKNEISHRGSALKKIKKVLEQT